MESQNTVGKYIMYLIFIILILYNLKYRLKVTFGLLIFISIFAIFKYIFKSDDKKTPVLMPENNKTPTYVFNGNCVRSSDYNSTKQRILNKIFSSSDYYLDDIDSLDNCNKLIPNNRKYIAFKGKTCLGFEKLPMLTTKSYCQPDICETKMITDDKGNELPKTICTVSTSKYYDNIPLYRRQ